MKEKWLKKRWKISLVLLTLLFVIVISIGAAIAHNPNNDATTMTWICDTEEMTHDMEMGVVLVKSVIQSWGVNVVEADNVTSALDGSDVFCFFNADSYIADFGNVLFPDSGCVCGLNLWLDWGGSTVFLILLNGSQHHSLESWQLTIIHEISHAYCDADSCYRCNYDEQMEFYRQCLINGGVIKE